MPFVLLACQVVLAIPLLLAATGKILNSEQFLSAILLSQVPRLLTAPVAVLVAALEICLAVNLIADPPFLLPLTLLATTVLLGIFTVWMFSVYTRGLRLKCGCSGTTDAEVGPRTIRRNLVLIAISFGGFILALNVRSVLPTLSPWMLIIICSLALGLMQLEAARQGKAALVLSRGQHQ